MLVEYALVENRENHLPTVTFLLKMARHAIQAETMGESPIDPSSGTALKGQLIYPLGYAPPCARCLFEPRLADIVAPCTGVDRTVAVAK
jgi:hypothetical protein